MAETARKGRPPTDPAIIGQGLALMAQGMSPQETSEVLAARGLKVSWRTLHAARAKSQGQGEGQYVLEPTESDPDADPLEVMRALLATTLAGVATLPADHVRRNAALTTATTITKAINAMESARAKIETPEEAEIRRRREAGETRTKIMRYVEQAEREAAERGVCIHCGAKRVAA